MLSKLKVKHMDNSNIALNSNILIVDDDPLNIRNASRILRDDYKVSYATSGKAALALIEKEIPDLILLDLHMPEMNGFDVLEVLKSKDEWKDISVIFLTADNDQDTEVKGLRAGALDFITKPFKEDIVKQRVKHLLELDHLKKELQEEVKIQTAKADERRLQMEEMSFQTVQALAGAIDAKDKYTKGHSARVSEYSVALAKRMGWEKTKIEELRYAALLHDVGKIGVPDAILNKRGRLSDVEFGVIKSHTSVGGDILKNITTVEGAVDVARHHHERFDGKGYPDKLNGTNISKMSRIVCIADSFDAMNSKRIYRDSLSREVIREELVKGKGTQFDPDFLQEFLLMYDNGELESITHSVSEETELYDSAALLQQVLVSALDGGYSTQLDTLTGLLMRGCGEERIREEMASGGGCLAMVDLDNLKKINDIFGHKNGDLLLTKVGELFLNMEGISVAVRLGGDEFLLLFACANRHEVELKLKEMYEGFAVIKDGNKSFCYNSLSCGLCFINEDDTFEEVYSNADKALYYAKQNGKGTYHFFERAGDGMSICSDVDLDALVSGFTISGEYQGAMKVDYREFTKLFEYVRNMKRRYKHEVQLVMVTVNANEEKSPSIETIEDAVNAIEGAIKNTIRTVDICTRYSNMQFLIILMGTKDNEVDMVVGRIFSDFYKVFTDNAVSLSYSKAKLKD